MAKNLIPEIAQMLGVELGEEFKLRCIEGKFYFKENELYFVNEVGESYIRNDFLPSVLRGELEIIKLPWKPNLNERYWTFMSSLEGRKLYVLNYMWDNSVIDVALHKVGWVYRTQEEAKSALPKVAKELGVEYEL